MFDLGTSKVISGKKINALVCFESKGNTVFVTDLLFRGGSAHSQQDLTETLDIEVEPKDNSDIEYKAFEFTMKRSLQGRNR
jgi:hypothetical protein